jgi:hypothetical protein
VGAAAENRYSARRKYHGSIINTVHRPLTCTDTCPRGDLNPHAR